MFHALGPNIIAFSTERHTEDFDNPYAGFNVTPYTGDHAGHVKANNKYLCKYLNITPNRLLIPRQVHGTRILNVTQEVLEQPGNRLDEVDGLVTDIPNVCIGVSTADCVPLLFHDTQNHAIAAVHAGWRGTVARIGVLALATMYDVFGSNAKDVQCIIGPSIGPAAFEVGDEVYEAFHLAGFPMQQIASKPITREGKQSRRWHIDLWEANAWQLIRAGVPQEAITITGICTYQNYNRFYSARRLGIKSGRIFSGILYKQEPTPTK